MPALDPVLGAAPGPKPFRATKEGGASSLAIQPPEGINAGRWREERPSIRGRPAQDPSREASLAL